MREGGLKERLKRNIDEANFVLSNISNRKIEIISKERGIKRDETRGRDSKSSFTLLTKRDCKEQGSSFIKRG